MIITAYFDESGTHGPSPLSLMAGFIADARQWRKFEKRSAKLFARYRVNTFHSIDLRRGDKDFRGWSVDKKIRFMDELQHIANETLERGFCSILRNDDYVSFYANKNRPKKVVRDSRYGLLFRASLASAIDGVLGVPRWREGSPPKLYVVLEEGHRNAGDAVRLYEFVRSKLSDHRQGPLSGLRFKSKAESLPLAAADLFAHSAYQEETGARPIGVPKGPIKSETSYRSNMFKILVGKESLEALYAQSISQYEERQKFGQRAKLVDSRERE